MSNRKLALLISIWLNIIVSSASIKEVFEKLATPDSLKEKYFSTQNSEKKVDVLNDIGFFFTSRNPESAITISHIALKISDSLKYEYGQYDAQNNMGIAFYRSSRFKQALACFNTAYDIAKNMNSKNKMAAIFSNMALVYNLLSDYEKALKYNFEALKIRTSDHDSIGIAISYNNLGTTYHYKSEFSQALEYYIKALKIKQAQHDKEGIASTYNNIGQLFFEMYSDTSVWVLDSALEYFLKAYYAWNSTSNKAGLSEVLPNIGNIYSLKNLNDRASDAYMAALNVQKQAQDSAGIALTFYNMGILNYNLSNFKLSKEYFDKSIQIARKYLIADLVKDNLKMLFMLAGNKGDYKTAYLHANEYVLLNDSLSELAHKHLVEDYLGKYEYRVSENMNLQKAINKAKTWMIILSVGAFVIIGLFLIWIIKKRKINT